jgi:hypothetical protein
MRPAYAVRGDFCLLRPGRCPMSTLSDTQMIVNVAGCLRPHARGNTHTDAQPNRTEPRPHSP